jgi:hypothetical protein
MMEQIEIRQLAINFLVNPNTGQTSVNGNLVSSLLLSNKRCFLIAHELVSFYYATAANVQLFEVGYLSFSIIRNPTGRINDARNFSLAPGVVNISNMQTIFVHNDFLPESIKPINLMVEPNQLLTIAYAAQLKQPPAAPDNSLQFTYRLHWQEME